MVKNVADVVLVDPNDSKIWDFKLKVYDQGSQASDSARSAISVRQIPWEFSYPAKPWVKDLMPFAAGIARSKNANPEGYALVPLQPADCMYPDEIVAGPAVSSLTLTSAVAQSTKMIQITDNAGTHILSISGRYVHKITGSGTVTTDRDLGASAVATDIIQVAGEVLVACGSTGFIQRRTAAGAWSTSADTYAHAFAVVKNDLWKVRTSTTAIDNRLARITILNKTDVSTMMTNANWTSTSPAYEVGDRTYQCNALYDVGGALSGGRPDGLFMADPAFAFVNVTPQIRVAPDSSLETGKGCWSAFGYFFIPYHRGLLRISPGFAEDVGPGTINLPNVGLRVRGGCEWDRMMYITCSDERTGALYILRMLPDRENISDGEYIFHPFYYRSASTTHYGRSIAMYNGAAGANPQLLFGGGSAATNAQYIVLGKGSGRDIDDSSYVFANADCNIVTGTFTPERGGAMNFTLVGTMIQARDASSGNAITPFYDISDSSDLNATPASAMGTVGAAGTTTITSAGFFIRYAAANAKGRFLNMRLTLNGSGSATKQPHVLAWKAFGFMNPLVTDEITLELDMRADVPGETRYGIDSPEEKRARMMQWLERGTVLTGQVLGYEEDLDRGVLFMVKSVDFDDSVIAVGNGERKEVVFNCALKLVRVDMSNQYGEDG